MSFDQFSITTLWNPFGCYGDDALGAISGKLADWHENQGHSYVLPSGHFCQVFLK